MTSAVMAYLLAAGCAEPFVLVAPGVGGAEPNANVTIALVDAGDTVPAYQVSRFSPVVPAHVAAPPGVLLISGTWWPGTASAKARRSDRAALLVDSLTIAGARDVSGAYWYGAEIPMSRVRSQVRVVLPGVEGFDTPGPVMLNGIARDPEANPAVDSEFIHIRVVSQAGVTPNQSQRWRAALAQDSARRQIDGSGLVPVQFAVPSRIAPDRAGPMTIRLAQEGFESSERTYVASKHYRYLLQLNSTLLWTVEVPE